MNTVTELLQPVENDLDDLILELKNLIGAGHPILQAAAEHLFSAGGKRLRPGIVLLISKAISPEFCLTTKHKRLAEITEMIHTASLVHDDVVDEASTRRGVDTVHSRFNTRVAVLACDFLFAQASWHLANLDNVNVVKLLSRVIMDLAEGEIKQNLNRFDSAQSFSIPKTACYESLSFKNVDFFVTSEKDVFFKKVKFWFEINKEIRLVNLRSNV